MFTAVLDSGTGGRAVEGTGLENRHTGEPGIESSNLSLSVEPELRHLRSVGAGVLCDSLDGWPSGLRRTPGKCVYVKAYREFESHPVRVTCCYVEH